MLIYFVQASFPITNRRNPNDNSMTEAQAEVPSLSYCQNRRIVQEIRAAAGGVLNPYYFYMHA